MSAMAATVFFLVVAGHWSPVSAATFCCATKDIGWNDDALVFEEAVFDDVGGEGKDTEYHCGAGLKLQLSVAKSAFIHDNCDLDAWIDKALKDPKLLADFAGALKDAATYMLTLWDSPNKLNAAEVDAKVHYYFKKLLAQAAYFAKDFSRTLSGGDLTQSPMQTSLLVGMAKVTAELRINCRYTSFFQQVVEKALRCKKGPQYAATKCKQLWDKRQSVKAKYCAEWTKVDPTKCNEGLSRHKGLFEKMRYFFYKSNPELSKHD
jgi:hypothetical protein